MRTSLTILKRTYCVYVFALMPAMVFSSETKTSFAQGGFLENKGQILNQDNNNNENVLFLYTGNGVKVQLRKTGYSYELFSLNEAQVIKKKSDSLNFTMQNYRVDIDFINCNLHPAITPSKKSSDHVNYYTGNYEITNVHSYGRVLYKDIYDFIDIEFLIDGNRPIPFKYNIILRPGADLNDVKFMISGATALKINEDVFEIATPLGLITEKIPFSYYKDSPGINRPVDFHLDQQVLSFAANYDPTRSLVIDPSSNLIWSTYYGGTAYDYCTSTGVDGQDNVYIAGHSLSTSNIATSGAYQSVLNGNLDAYLAKFNASGVRQWASYFGGNNFEQIFSIFVEANGNVYLTGDTFSANNIASAGAHQTVYGGGIDDAILVKFGSGGQRLWSTYFGGTEHDIAQSVTVDNVGNVIITGHTQSLNMATPGAYSTVYNLAYDVFIAKFNSSGFLYWCTYYGDSGVDEAYGVATDASNNVYITGITGSIAGISTPASHQPNAGGLSDAFIAKFNSLGNVLIWGTYYGGSSDDHGNVIRIKGNSNVYVAGTTTSSNNIATANAYQGTTGSADDAFIVAFNTAGLRQWGTYFGGEDTDYITDMVIDANTNLVLCGQTLSTNSISTVGAYQPSLSTVNNYDAFFAKFSNGGARKLASYFGGPSNESAKGIAVNNTGKIYIVGETTSGTNISSLASHQPTAGGSQDGYLAKFCMDIEPLISPRNTSLCIGNNTLTATDGYATYLWN
ncbi:MAG: SBBP repeat-containing protein, partial [Bacteroidota bacterium]